MATPGRHGDPPVADKTGAPPRVGMLATLRNRRGIISAVEPFDGSSEGRFHLVTVEYLDAEFPQEEQVIWEREVGARLLEPTALPSIINEDPMLPDDFDVLVRAVRWTALLPFSGTSFPSCPLTAPFHGAIQIEDFQLVPLLKALRMPRVALLLADDVGLGKTIEAGLILTELLIRRRVRRVLVLCPASLRLQWKQEMRDKFSIPFDIVDRAATFALQKRLGFDANPWRTFSRIITSYDYLKQPDILEQFRAACRVPEGSPHLPWDLLIVDEAHNLAPAPLGEESDLTRMLRAISPYFEHKLFLTATPHNGHTRSFTGLLECLDPVRFTQKNELTEADRRRVEQVVVRRLKSEVNARANPPLFCERSLVALPLHLSQEERALSRAFEAFRQKVRSLVSSLGRNEQLAGSFAVEVLGKRLLSCPVTFADSWRRYCDGLREIREASVDEVQAARKSVREETHDDREAEARGAHAALTVGAWLRPFAHHITGEMAAIDDALKALGLRPDNAVSVRNVASCGSISRRGSCESIPREGSCELIPRKDARFDALCSLIEDKLRTSPSDVTAGPPAASTDANNQTSEQVENSPHAKAGTRAGWRPDERLVIFTEYKTTLDYLESRLATRYPDEGVIRVLFGGMDEGEREAIKAAFNDPGDPVRILIATDAAAEGLNLQETARYILHYDIPWNPARLEQRNGRLDRHGQARDVVVYHFATDDDADLSFLAYVIGKVHTIREDLGSTGQVFDSAIERRLVAGEEASLVRASLEAQLNAVRGRGDVPRVREEETGREALMALRGLAREVDLDPETMRETLDAALGLNAGRPRLEGPDAGGRFRLKSPIPHEWEALIDDALRLDIGGSRAGRGGIESAKGPLPAIIFDPSRFIRDIGGRRVFRPEKEVVLLHLGHPLISRAVVMLARARFPGAGGRVTRWTVRRGDVPDGADALILLTVEELAVNELREAFHHWVRTLQIPVRDGSIDTPLPHLPAAALRAPSGIPNPADIEKARDIWDEVSRDIRSLISDLSNKLTRQLAELLERERIPALNRENERFQSRQGEISALMEQLSIAHLEQEIAELKTDRLQGVLFDADRRLEEIDRSIAEKEEELRRRRVHYEELREQLQRERERVIRGIIPKRYALRGKALVFPVAVEIRLPGEGR